MSAVDSSIWVNRPSSAESDAMHVDTLVSHVGIQIVEVGDDYLVGSMPVDARTRQVHGILHGGASLVLAETLGSYAANCCVDLGKRYCVGLEINANHLRSVSSGEVRGTAQPLHLGGRTQVWAITIRDQENRRVCESRLTMAVIDKPAP